MIKLNNVNKYYNKGKQNEIHVINDISLELPTNGIVALFGKSGCGKTTLLNVIGGLDKFESGNVIIDDNDICNNTDYIRNKYIGYIFQNYNLNNNESCYDNVLSSLKLSGVTDPKISDELVMNALKNVGIDKFKKRLPNTLSGGQQQRVAIARALVKNPKIILADEPTGNLDENNTILIMNLLKRISKNHLVLLVTHEEKLVENYCDMIINLSDGKVININSNYSDDCFETKNKNEIYLGEFEKKEVTNDNTVIEYYGDNLKDKIKIKLVNNNGTIYLKVDSDNVKIIDDSNEIKLKEGKFEQKKIKDNLDEFEIKSIEEYQVNKFGKLFNFKDSIKSGFVNNFVGKKKKKEKALHRLLMLFSLVIVFMTAVFGTAFLSLENVEKSYNHNVFYVNVNSKKNEQLIRNGISDKNSFIDSCQINYNNYSGDMYLDFNLGGFETVVSNYKTNINATGVPLGNDIIKNSKVLAGKIDNLEEHNVIISKGLADKIIKNSKFGNISEYKDLIGLYCTTFMINGKVSLVSGIVDSKDNAIYLEESYLAQYNINRTGYQIKSSKDYNMDINDNEVIYLAVSSNNVPKLGDNIVLNGYEFKVKEVIRYIRDYIQWLQLYYPLEYISEELYFDNIIKSKYSDYTENYNNYYKIVENEYYFEYLDYLYQRYDEYIEELYMFSSDINLYIYYDKNIEMAKYNTSSGLTYYCAKQYKNIYNRYPKLDELNQKEIDTIKKQMENYIIHYEDDFYMNKHNSIYSDTYIVSTNDLINIATIRGSSTKTDLLIDHELKYLTIHSSNPEKTLEWLESLDLDDIDSTYSYGYETIISPNTMRNRLINEIKDSVKKQIITLVVIIAIMCVCMFFIMKASVMNRIREIGIYRSIGVSKKNLLFKYLIEVIVLTTLTVIVGYIISSIFIMIASNASKSIITLLYYPWYLALIVFIGLYAISIISGLVPIISLILRTPSEILTKYDI